MRLQTTAGASMKWYKTEPSKCLSYTCPCSRWAVLYDTFLVGRPTMPHYVCGAAVPKVTRGVPYYMSLSHPARYMPVARPEAPASADTIYSRATSQLQHRETLRLRILVGFFCCPSPPSTRRVQGPLP